jgi:hypothetical protein
MKKNDSEKIVFFYPSSELLFWAMSQTMQSKMTQQKTQSKKHLK